jgi:hypothetical protein
MPDVRREFKAILEAIVVAVSWRRRQTRNPIRRLVTWYSYLLHCHLNDIIRKQVVHTTYNGKVNKGHVGTKDSYSVMPSHTHTDLTGTDQRATM